MAKINDLLYMKTISKIKIDIHVCFAWVGCIEGSHICPRDILKTMLHMLKKTMRFRSNDWLIDELHMLRNIMLSMKDDLLTFVHYMIC